MLKNQPFYKKTEEEYGMKITGTKKFLILFITLICAIAVGLGIMLAGPNNSASAKEVQTVAENPEAQDGDKLTPPDSASVEDEELSETEEEYDPRFDEFELRTLAEQMNLDYELVNFYAHATDTGVAELKAFYEFDNYEATNPFSYTHLTLQTICSV